MAERGYSSYGAGSGVGYDTTPYDRRHEQTLEEYGKIAAERKRQLDDERAKLEEAELARERNWHSKAAGGASLGATFSGGSPWGALVGGVIGGGLGLYGATKSRMKDGQSWYGALGDSMTDVSGLTSGEFLGASAPAAAAIGNYTKSKQQSQEPLYGGSSYSDMDMQQPQSLEDLQAGGEFSLSEPGALDAYSASLRPQPQRRMRF